MSRLVEDWLAQAWESPPGRPPAGAPVLGALEGLYKLGLRLRVRRTPRRAPIPVVSVGSLWVGGAGKSPMAAEIASLAAEEGLTPAILLRGYRASVQGAVRVPSGSHEALRYGDEAAMHAAQSPASVYVGPDRYQGALQAARDGCRLAVLDDGMQHRALARDLEVVTLRGDRPFGNGRLLPRGPLREPPEALRRAHVVILAHTGGPEPSGAAIAGVRRLAPGVPIFSWRDRIEVRPLRRSDPDPNGGSEPAASGPRGRIGAFAGIAWPEAFRGALEAHGLAVAWMEAYPDHHMWSREELEAILARAAREGCEGVITTEKDAARLGGPSWAWLPASIRVARLTIAWNEPEAREWLRTMLRDFKARGTAAVPRSGGAPPREGGDTG